MSNIDKQALRSTSERDWFEDWFKREFHPDKTGPYIKDQLFFAVRAARAPLLDEMEDYKAAYEEESRDKEVQRSVIDDALCKLLPGCQYMDPPDGGSVTPLEQVSRMIADYREQLQAAEKRIVELASLEAEPVPEWTNEQCLEFLSIAFRHAEINGDLQLDDIRLGVKMVNGSRPAMLQGADGNSPVIPDCWVACSERMPDETQPVITVSEGGVVQRTVYQFCDGVWSDWYDLFDIVSKDSFTHWMPLPAAPLQEVK